VSSTAGPRPLPGWYTGNRVKGTTRLSIARWGGMREFTHAAEGFEALGARVFTRHVKTGEEDPWPRDVWQQMIDEARGRGLKMVGYYWHMAETAVADDPSRSTWVCKEDDRTTPIEGDRGTSLDTTGPYRELVLERLLLLAELGVDGFMFDERHLPPKGCWGSALEDAWAAEHGSPAPTPRDPLYPEFLDFKAAQIEETFAYWRDSVKAAHPGVVFVVSTTTIPALTLREMTTGLARVADSPKNEYRLALNRAFSGRVFDEDSDFAPADHVRQAVGWTVLRDSAEGRPPYVWVSGVPNVPHARAAAGSLLTFGCIANMDVDEQSLLGTLPPGPGKTPLDALRAAFELGRVASPHLSAAQPLRWTAVHFAERARNERGTDYRGAWLHMLWPLVGAFQVLSEDGLPVGVVNDHQLEQGELAGYRVLVLPARDELTARQEKAVSAFAARGGVVIENDRMWDWSDPAGRETAFAALRAAFRRHVVTAPLRVSGGPPGRYGVAYRNGSRLVVAVTNDFGWVQITKREDLPSEIHQPPPPASGVQVAWRKGHKLPETWDGLPFPRLRALEAISGKTLSVKSFSGGYRVELPPFRALALLVVSRSLRPLGPHEPAPGPADVA
jgi:hypothetical protein